LGAKDLHFQSFKPMQILRRLLAPQNDVAIEFFRSLGRPVGAELKLDATIAWQMAEQPTYFPDARRLSKVEFTCLYRLRKNWGTARSRRHYPSVRRLTNLRPTDHHSQRFNAGMAG
jgi:hypothetical protein